MKRGAFHLDLHQLFERQRVRIRRGRVIGPAQRSEHQGGAEQACDTMHSFVIDRSPKTLFFPAYHSFPPNTVVFRDDQKLEALEQAVNGRTAGSESVCQRSFARSRRTV